MPITDRTLAAGTRLITGYKGAIHYAEVVETEQGLRYRLDDGRVFRSPSSAGAAVMGPGRTCNGWAFWSVSVGDSLPERAPRTQTAPGDTVWICSKCEVVFETESGLDEHFAQEHPKLAKAKHARHVERTNEAISGGKVQNIAERLED